MSEQSAVAKKKIILSGIQPTGIFTLGNYIGAVNRWQAMQEEFTCAYFLADLHSITVRQDPKTLRQRCLETFALLLACGIDPEKSLIFIQSHVPAHAEASWILQCHTQFGELSRMTQFKDKSLKNPENINSGLFSYPSLMAADILLYQADLVPVGEDQKQHLEITRDVANRFNNLYGKTFKVPDPYIAKVGAKIMSLVDPTKKMSKSDDNPRATVSVLDQPETIMKKFRSATTDSDTRVCVADGKDGINNLITIYSIATGQSFDAIEKEFEGKGYGDFKKAVGESVVETLKPVRERHESLMKDRDFLVETYTKGAEMAQKISERTLVKMKKKVGLIV